MRMNYVLHILAFSHHSIIVYPHSLPTVDCGLYYATVLNTFSTIRIISHSPRFIPLDMLTDTLLELMFASKNYESHL